MEAVLIPVMREGGWKPRITLCVSSQVTPPPPSTLQIVRVRRFEATAGMYTQFHEGPPPPPRAKWCWLLFGHWLQDCKGRYLAKAVSVTPTSICFTSAGGLCHELSILPHRAHGVDGQPINSADSGAGAPPPLTYTTHILSGYTGVWS